MSALTRVVAGRLATITHTFLSDPVPDTATVSITRADGTVLTPTASVDNSGVGVSSITLTPTETALLDTLTVTWTATFGGQAQAFTDRVEVVGGVLFTIAEMRAESSQLASTTEYPDSKIAEMRTTVENALERRIGYALVPRYSRDTVSGDGAVLRLNRPYVRAIRSVSVGGVALTADDLATISYQGTWLYGRSWTSGYSNVVVGYEHGRDNDDPEANLAAITLAKAWLIKGPVDDRALGFASDVGTYSLATPGRGGSSFGLPFVDEFVASNRLPTLA